MVSACRSFGLDAERWSRRLRFDAPLVAADASDAARALEAAVLARIADGPQAIAVFVDEPRAALGVMLAAAIFAQQPQIDARRAALDQLSAGTLQVGEGRTSGSLTLLQPQVHGTLKALYDLADVLVVRSWAERERLHQLFGGTRPSVCRVAPHDPDVPAPASSPRGGRDAIVVWAPKRTAAEAAFFAFPFHEMDLPVIVVCEGGERPAMGRTTFLEAGTANGAAAIRSARIVIDAELSDPGVAMALAAHEVPLVVSSSSGAYEYLDPVHVYDPWNWRSLHRAGMTALGGRAPDLPAPSADAPWQIREPEIPSNPPLVSVVIPTYNRREILPRSMEVWSRQRYPNYEIVLVNDGGAAVDDIAARFPRVRLINLEQNVGMALALERGVNEAVGDFLVLPDDDDEYAPDHILQLVAALERTRGNVAYTNMIVRHERGSAGNRRTVGYSLPWNHSMDRTTVLYEGITLVQSMLLRRSVYGAPCWIDPDPSLPTGKSYAMILELALRHDFIHVDTSSVLYSLRADDDSSLRRQQRPHEASALRTIYARYPTPDRPAITQRRLQVVAMNERTGSDMFVEPAIRLRE